MDGMRGNQIRSREELSPRAKKGGCSNLRESVHTWPTPIVSDGSRTMNSKIDKKHPFLTEIIKTMPSGWPTPRTVDGTGGAVKLNKRGKRQSKTTGMEFGATLRDSVHTWPTPRTNDYKGGRSLNEKGQRISKTNPHLKFGANLEDIAKTTWSTPNTMDHLPLRSDEAVEKLATTHRKGRTSPANLREQVNPEFMKKWKETTWPTPSTRDYKGGYQGGRTRNGQISTDTLDITAQLTGEQSNGSNVETAKPGRS
jgi:hypothetical protein